MSQGQRVRLCGARAYICIPIMCVCNANSRILVPEREASEWSAS